MATATATTAASTTGSNDRRELGVVPNLTAGDEEARPLLPGKTRVPPQKLRVLKQRLVEQHSAVNGRLSNDENNT